MGGVGVWGHEMIIVEEREEESESPSAERVGHAEIAVVESQVGLAVSAAVRLILIISETERDPVESKTGELGMAEKEKKERESVIRTCRRGGRSRATGPAREALPADGR